MPGFCCCSLPPCDVCETGTSVEQFEVVLSGYSPGTCGSCDVDGTYILDRVDLGNGYCYWRYDNTGSAGDGCDVNFIYMTISAGATTHTTNVYLYLVPIPTTTDTAIYERVDSGATVDCAAISSLQVFLFSSTLSSCTGGTVTISAL